MGSSQTTSPHFNHKTIVQQVDQTRRTRPIRYVELSPQPVDLSHFGQKDAGEMRFLVRYGDCSE
jgi:hypothetical protein